jgi:hypothetical protein
MPKNLSKIGRKCKCDRLGVSRPARETGQLLLDALDELHYKGIILMAASSSWEIEVDRFGKRELAVVRHQLVEAETLLSRYYCIPGREWPAYAYDVETLSDLTQSEAIEGILALVAKYEYRPPRSSGGQERLEFYRICLQDHNILAASGHGPGGISFEALLLYILTHELVHVFRFASQPQRYFADSASRVVEERSVHRITSDILRMKKDRRLVPVLRAYQEYPFVSEQEM